MSSLRHFNGKEIYKVFNLIVIRERQIHTKMRCYYTPNIIAETKAERIYVGKKVGHTYTVGGSVNCFQSSNWQLSGLNGDPPKRYIHTLSSRTCE